MKNSQMERKKYSVHNLVKLINERNKQNIRNKQLSVGADGTTSIKIGDGLDRETHNDFFHMENNGQVGGKDKATVPSEVGDSSGDYGVRDGNVDDGDECDDDDEHDDKRDDERAACTYGADATLPPPGHKEIKLFMFDYNECQNQKCSCKKLYKFKKIKKAPINKKFKGIVLTPFCEKLFSINDKATVENFGLSVIDCSWKSLDLLKKCKFANQRKLPYIIAVNSINYGKPYKLSCLESLAFCLYVCGYNKQCTDILNIYKWSSSFVNLNEELLDMYKLCNTHEEVKNVEDEFIHNSLNEKEKRKKIDHYKVIYEDGYL
ncbi:pre-rRNA-processing protein TSR3 [Plasmodium inui San Antonio 1]|uniref:18S rRNA aminocarboxypropyltransferase n=1 Tax=Plasmodium inui San Antonio 1 TaxID=1237626 RepID=W7ACP4_9APIC|nr:pre-rRNA-processing protein TSR3 [Plasmodium inui San Antonio 1]EUD69058.1 pre-rRNA-processing protein TSR3 [Plasmodium inui San Antonio 1]